MFFLGGGKLKYNQIQLKVLTKQEEQKLCSILFSTKTASKMVSSV